MNDPLAPGAVIGILMRILWLGAPRWLGAITPIGGTLLIAGWLWLAWTVAKG